MHDSTTVVAEVDEYIEHAERDCLDREEINRGQVREMIVEKCPPIL